MMSNPKILLLAQNPKTEFNVSHALAKTRSGSVLRTWMSKASLEDQDVLKLNTYNDVGSRSYTHAKIKKDARTGEWKSLIENFPIIVTLGKTAELAVKETVNVFFKDRTDLKIYHLPHPSGLNRKLNDPEWHNECVQLLRKVKILYKGLL